MLSASAAAATPVVPWDGTNPFRCQLQNVGTGADFPDPGADPFCVEFDKTQPERDRLRRSSSSWRWSPPAWRPPAPSASTSRPTTGPARSSRASRPSCGTGTAATSSTRRKAVGGVSVQPPLGGVPSTRAAPRLPDAALALLRPGARRRPARGPRARPSRPARRRSTRPAEAPPRLPRAGPVLRVGPLSRREVLQRASALGVGGLVLSSLPVAERILAVAAPAAAAPSLTDGDAPGVRRHADPRAARRRARTSGNEIHPKAIAGAHPEPGAVQADTLLLYHHPLIGFDLVAPAFLADLEARSAAAARAVPRPAVRQARGGLHRRARPVQPHRPGLGAGGRRAVRGLPLHGHAEERDDRQRPPASR